MEKESESDPDLVVNMIYKLETGADYMEDLVSVLKDLNKEYRYEDIDKDKFYEVSAKAGGQTSGGGTIGGWQDTGPSPGGFTTDFLTINDAHGHIMMSQFVGDGESHDSTPYDEKVRGRRRHGATPSSNASRRSRKCWRAVSVTLAKSA